MYLCLYFLSVYGGVGMVGVCARMDDGVGGEEMVCGVLRCIFITHNVLAIYFSTRFLKIQRKLRPPARK